MHDRTLVLTPEKVVVSYTLASLPARIGAHLLDLVVVFGIYFLVVMLSIASGLGMSEEGSGFVFLFTSFGIFLYFILSEGLFQGRTLGKKFTGLRVLSVDGTPLTWSGAFFRNILRVADMLPGPYLVGFIAIFMNEKSQRIGDLVSGTVVVRDAVLPTHFTPAPHRAGVHPLEHTVGDLEGMTLYEYVAIKRLCDRFPALPPEEMRMSIVEIWEPFAKRQKIEAVGTVHPIYQMEATVMKYGRQHNLV